MKQDNRIFKLTFVGFGFFLMLLCFAAYLDFQANYSFGKGISYRMFDSCVTVLGLTAELFCTDYRTINVVIFCIIMPLAFIGLFVHNLVLRSRINDLSFDVYEQNRDMRCNSTISIVKATGKK